MPQADGYSLRQHYEAAARQGNPEAGRQLEGPELPYLHAELWGWFLELDRARGQGPAALAYESIEAWARLTGRRLSPDDVALIVDLDRLGFQVRAEAKK